MPGWLQVISRVNPLTYEVDALRALMLVGGQPTQSLAVDILVLLVVTIALTAIGGRLYPNAAN